MLTEADLKIIGIAIDAVFSHWEGVVPVFGSNTFPQHRITVDAAKAEAYLAKLCEQHACSE